MATKWRRMVCKSCGRKLVMWKLIGMSKIDDTVRICHPCALDFVDKCYKLNINGYPDKQALLKSARIVKVVVKPMPSFGF